MSEAQVIPNADGEDVIDEIVPARLQSKLLPILDPEEHFAKLATVLPNLRAASIKLTHGQDWVRMGSSVYFQAIGAERIAPLWGLALGEPDVQREEYADGTFAYVVTGPVMSRLTGVVYAGIQGGRWSGEDFFERWSEPKPARAEWQKLQPAERTVWESAHRLPPNPLDVRKAAVCNWQVRCVTMITGLRGLTPEDLAKHGVVPKSGFDYRTGGEGGKAQTTNEAGEKVIPFGKSKAKTLKEIEPSELSSLLTYFDNASKDPAKKQYKASNEAWVSDIEREIQRRTDEAQA